MLTLSLIWLGLGVVVGLAALAAQLAPPRWGGWRWLALPALGAVAALLGGWLGALLFDRVQASLAAVWASILAVVVAGLIARRTSPPVPLPLRVEGEP
jgi:hypothetical protein